MSTCLICFDDKITFSVCNKGHNICNDCFNEYIKYECKKDILLRKFNCHNCHYKIKNKIIKNNINNDTLILFNKSVKEIREHKYQRSYFKKYFINTIKNFRKEKEYLKVRNNLEFIKSPSCPNCKQVFYDINKGDCMAAKCSNCSVSFCAYCCDIHGSSDIIHSHLPKCSINSSKTIFGDKNFKMDQQFHINNKIIKILEKTNKNILDELYNNKIVETIDYYKNFERIEKERIEKEKREREEREKKRIEKEKREREERERIEREERERRIKRIEEEIEREKERERERKEESIIFKMFGKPTKEIEIPESLRFFEFNYFNKIEPIQLSQLPSYPPHTPFEPKDMYMTRKFNI